MRLNYLAGKSQVNIATSYRMNYPFCRCLSYFADRHAVHRNQSASQDCPLATNQHLKSADLQHRHKNKPTAFQDSAPARVINLNHMAQAFAMHFSFSFSHTKQIQLSCLW